MLRSVFFRADQRQANSRRVAQNYGFCSKNRVDCRSGRENSTTFARARGIVRASYASIRVFPWRAQLRPRALRPWITAATSILEITASSQRLCSCFRVLLNASCVNRTAPKRIISDSQNEAVNRVIVTSDQSIKTWKFCFARRLSFLIRFSHLATRQSAAPPGGSFHLSPRSTEMTERSAQTSR